MSTAMEDSIWKQIGALEAQNEDLCERLDKADALLGSMKSWSLVDRFVYSLGVWVLAVITASFIFRIYGLFASASPTIRTLCV